MKKNQQPRPQTEALTVELDKDTMLGLRIEAAFAGMALEEWVIMSLKRILEECNARDNPSLAGLVS